MPKILKEKFPKLKLNTAVVLVLMSIVTITALLLPFKDKLYFNYSDSPVTIEIAPTGEKNELSNAEGILIKRISSGMGNLDLRELFPAPKWKDQDGGIVWAKYVSEDVNAAKLTYTFNPTALIKITFLENPWCGMFELTINGHTTLYDAYSDKDSEMTIPLNKLIGLPRLNVATAIVSLLLFVAVFGLLWKFHILLFKFVMRYIRTNHWLTHIGVLICTCAAALVSASKSSVWIIPAVILIFPFICCTAVKVWRGRDSRIKRMMKDYRTYVMILVFAIIILVPLTYLVKNFRVNETYDNHGQKYSVIELSAGTSILQNLYFDGKYKSISIDFDKQNENISGEFQIKLSQGNAEWTGTHSYADGVYSANITLADNALKQFKKGEIQLQISGIRGHTGSSITLPISVGLTFGGFYINGELKADVNAAISVAVSSVPYLSFARLAMICILLILFALLVKSVYNKQEGYSLYFLCVGVIVVSLCFSLPYWSFFSEPFYEGGSNFLQQTYERSVRDSFFLEDYAYWPLFSRLISYLVIKVLGLLYYAPVAMDMLKVIIVGLMLSQFCMKQYGEYANKSLRLLFCLMLALNPLYTYIFSIINFGYFGIMVILLNFLLDFDKLSKKHYALILASSILCLTKAHYILLLPFVGIAAVICLIKKLNRRWLIYFVCLSFASFLQFSYVFVKGFLISRASSDYLPDVFVRSFYYLTTNILRIFETTSNALNQSGYFWHFIIGLGFIAIFLLSLVNISSAFKSNDKLKLRLSAVISVSMMFIFLSQTFYVMAQKQFNNPSFLWSDVIRYNSYDRQVLFVPIAIFFVILVNLIMLTRQKSEFGIGLTLVFIILLTPQLSTVSGYQNIDTLIKGWQFYSQDMATKDSYALSVGRYRFITKNAEVLYIGSNDNVDQSVWNFTFGASPEIKLDNMPVHSVYTSEMANKSEMPPITIIYARKQGLIQNTNEISAVFYNKDGNVIANVEGRAEDNAGDIIFNPETSIYGVDHIDFVGKDGGYVDLRPDFYIGVEKYN